MNVYLSEDFSGWPPEQTVFPIAGLDLRVLPGDHPFYVAEQDAIAENWARETAATPRFSMAAWSSRSGFH